MGSVDKESGYFLKYLLQKQLMGTDNKSVPIIDFKYRHRYKAESNSKSTRI